MALKPETKDKLVAALVDWRKSMMFGDGQEEDYLIHGFPDYKPISQLSEDELIAEFRMFVEETNPLLRLALIEWKGTE